MKKSKILIGNISADTTEEIIRELLTGTLGAVTSITFPLDPKTRKGKGYAICEVASDVQATQAVTTLNGYNLDGRQLAITVAEVSGEKRKWYQIGNK